MRLPQRPQSASPIVRLLAVLLWAALSPAAFGAPDGGGEVRVRKRKDQGASVFPFEQIDVYREIAFPEIGSGKELRHTGFAVRGHTQRGIAHRADEHDDSRTGALVVRSLVLDAKIDAGRVGIVEFQDEPRLG